MSQLLTNLNDFISELNTYEKNIDIVLATKYASINDINTISTANSTIIFGEKKR